MILEYHAQHPQCQGAIFPRLPARVINVQHWKLPKVHLHGPHANGKFDLYVTLSYCWGGSQPIVALKYNLEDLKSGISVAALPQTLQDAVRTTRDLGFRYLWVTPSASFKMMMRIKPEK